MMDDELSESKIRENSSESMRDSILGQNDTAEFANLTKCKSTCIVDPAEILTEKAIRTEGTGVNVEKIALVHETHDGNTFSEWNVTRIVCNDMLACLQWMAKRRLIANSFTCPRCGKDCTFQLRRDRTDKYNWTCNYPCNFKKSVREGSFFAGSHLSLPTILQLINLWVLKTKQDKVQVSLGIKQRHTIVDWYAFIREICARKVLDNPQHVGGLHEETLEGVIVSFGVFDFKHTKDEREETYWVILGVESGTDRCFVVPVESCDPKKIVAILRKYVEPGSVLLGRPFELDADDKTSSIPEEFAEFAHDYSITLDLTRDFSSAACSQYDIEDTELWKLIRCKHRSKSDFFREEPTSSSLFQCYLQEAIWRRMHADDLFSHMVADIGIYYPV